MKHDFADASKTKYLMRAAQEGTSQDVERLLKLMNVDMSDEAGETALMKASRRTGAEARDIAQMLLNHGADIQRTNKFGQTALDIAEAGSEVRKLLIDHGGRTGAELRARASIHPSQPKPV